MSLTAAILAAFLLALVIAFQIGLAAVAPWGRASWGGRQPDILPRHLRIASGVSALVLGLIAVAVLVQGNALAITPPAYLRWATWGIAGLLALSAVGNVLSPSRAERTLLGPLALVTSALCAVVAWQSGAT